METRDDGAEALKSVSATDESVAVLHAKALLEDCAITVRVRFEFHSNRNIVTVDSVLERFICFDARPVFHEDCCVPRRFYARTWIPAEFVA